ncbi:hypothetical protein [[Clostridium] symbiosum]|uniref:hypothetical protein n=1 Tax=Clostridium symbiosum TaxID=1512 RepID=UPI0034A3C92F
MKTRLLQIDLQMFDGAAGAASGATAAPAATGVNTGAAPQAAAGEQAEIGKEVVIYGKPPEELNPENQLATGEGIETKNESPEERQAAFEKLIKEDYKDLFDSRVQSIIGRRLGDVKGLEKQVQSANEIMELMSLKYGVDATDTAALKKAIEEDDTYWEEAAEKENLSVEQYKRMKKMEAENATLKREREEAERNSQKEQVFAKWSAEAETVKNFYPGFDLNTELQNEQFLRLLGAGIDMRTTYETIHHDEIMTGVMSYTAKQVAKKQADAIKSGYMRPAENGISSRAAVTVKRDPSKLTAEDMKEIAKRVRAGETITF